MAKAARAKSHYTGSGGGTKMADPVVFIYQNAGKALTADFSGFNFRPSLTRASAHLVPVDGEEIVDEALPHDRRNGRPDDRALDRL
jgi:hypothetical protein